MKLGAVFVIANSLVDADKYITAGSCYNKRVVECRLAARVLAGYLNLDKVGCFVREGERRMQ